MFELARDGFERDACEKKEKKKAKKKKKKKKKKKRKKEKEENRSVIRPGEARPFRCSPRAYLVGPIRCSFPPLSGGGSVWVPSRRQNRCTEHSTGEQ
jgi:hypothetical protein